MAATTRQQGVRELAVRASNGVKVTLLWDRESDDLTVCVNDRRKRVYFELAAERERALDVFHHPYAHAAARGIAYEEPFRNAA
jgi:hypothetical protein